MAHSTETIPEGYTIGVTKPRPKIVFHNVMEFDTESGEITFFKTPQESAKLFAEYVKKYWLIQD